MSGGEFAVASEYRSRFGLSGREPARVQVRAIQKLVQNGNSTAVTIPRPILIHLGWLPGEAIVIELLEDNSLRVRRPVERDFAPLGAPRLVYDPVPAEHK